MIKLRGQALSNCTSRRPIGTMPYSPKRCLARDPPPLLSFDCNNLDENVSDSTLDLTPSLPPRSLYCNSSTKARAHRLVVVDAPRDVAAALQLLPEPHAGQPVRYARGRAAVVDHDLIVGEAAVGGGNCCPLLVHDGGVGQYLCLVCKKVLVDRSVGRTVGFDQHGVFRGPVEAVAAVV